MPRDELAEALWGPAPPATWDKALTVIASKLRGAPRRRRRRRRRRADERVRLLPARSTGRLLGRRDRRGRRSRCGGASARTGTSRSRPGPVPDRRCGLLRQPFLPGEDGAWVEAKRRELDDVQGRALNVLADACLRLGDAPEAAKWAEQAIALEPFRESGLSTADGGARGRGQPGRGAPGVRTVPAAARRGARRVSVAGDRLDLPPAPGRAGS